MGYRKWIGSLLLEQGNLGSGAGLCNGCGIMIHEVLPNGKAETLRAEIDHIVPESRPWLWNGDIHDLWNLQALCGKCNAEKFDKTEKEWMITKPNDWVEKYANRRNTQIRNRKAWMSNPEYRRMVYGDI